MPLTIAEKYHRAIQRHSELRTFTNSKLAQLAKQSNRTEWIREYLLLEREGTPVFIHLIWVICDLPIVKVLNGWAAAHSDTPFKAWSSFISINIIFKPLIYGTLAFITLEVLDRLIGWAKKVTKLQEDIRAVIAYRIDTHTDAIVSNSDHTTFGRGSRQVRPRDLTEEEALEMVAGYRG